MAVDNANILLLLLLRLEPESLMIILLIYVFFLCENIYVFFLCENIYVFFLEWRLRRRGKRRRIQRQCQLSLRPSSLRAASGHIHLPPSPLLSTPSLDPRSLPLLTSTTRRSEFRLTLLRETAKPIPLFLTTSALF